MESWRTMSKNENVSEIGRVVDIFEVCFHPHSQLVKIKIVETADGKYMPFANYRIQNPDQASPYQSCHLENSPDEALRGAINGFCAFIPSEPEKLEQTKWVKEEEW